MTTAQQVKLDEVTVYVHVMPSPDTAGVWRWYVTSTPELPQYQFIRGVNSGRCEADGITSAPGAIGRWFAVRAARRAARRVATRLAGRVDPDYQRFTYTATWGVDDEETR